MEERNLELDDDGKIKLKKNREDFLSDAAEDAGDDIVIEVPDFEAFREEDNKVGLSAEELAEKAKEREALAEERKSTAEKLLEEADKLFDAGDLDGAGEKYLDSAAEYAADWRPWFGVVRVETKNLTDFKNIYDCQKAYERALRRMSGQERKSIAERYVPSMERIVSESAAQAEALEKQDDAERAAARGAVRAECKARTRNFVIFSALFALFAIAGGVLASFISSVRGMQILIPAVICIAAAVVLLFCTAWSLRKFIYAGSAQAANGRAGTTQADRESVKLREYAELVQSIIDDFTKE